MFADHIVISMQDQEVDYGTVMFVRRSGGLSRTEGIYPKTYKMIRGRAVRDTVPCLPEQNCAPFQPRIRGWESLHGDCHRLRVGCVDWVWMFLPGQRGISVSLQTRCSMFTPSVPSPLSLLLCTSSCRSPRDGLPIKSDLNKLSVPFSRPMSIPRNPDND